MATSYYTPKDINRFWSKVDKSAGDAGCWTWISGKNKLGYGRIAIRRVATLAHRVSYELAYGGFNKELSVCHSCDNPSCVNPKHLWLGTRADNNRDRNRKGNTVHPTGELTGSCKLSDKQVAEIRARFHNGETNRRQLGREYGVSHQQIRVIVNYEQRMLGTGLARYQSPEVGVFAQDIRELKAA